MKDKHNFNPTKVTKLIVLAVLALLAVKFAIPTVSLAFLTQAATFYFMASGGFII